ncbi:tandem-95 repeat protein, partial [Massilia solisilvae]
PVNDAPVLAVSPVTVAQGATITLTTSYLNATDVDIGNGSLTYTVTTAPGKGTIKVNGTAATSFTQQDVIDGKVSYTANSYGSDQSDSFSVSVSDGALSDAKPVAVTITSANVAPTSTGGTVTTAEDTNYVFRASDFNFSDFNTGDAMTKVSISAAPGAGKLQAYVSGAWQDVGASASVTTAEINLGHLRFVPVADANGDPYTTFSYKVYDNASAASNDATMTVKVTPVNDLPVAADGTITTNEDTRATGNLPAATDVEHDAITYAKGTGPSHGTLVLNADGSYEYTPAANYNGPDSFTYTVSDGSGSNTYNVSITVNPVNDAPMLAVAPVTVGQGATITLGTSYLNATDVDTGNGSLTYTVTSAPGKGTIKVNGTAATSFTQQDVIDGKVSYTANSYGSDQSDSFSVSVSDGALSDAKPVAVTITSANVAPTSTGGAVTTAEDTNYVFRASDFNFSDFNTGDAMTKVSISAAPGAGKLQAYVSGAWQDVGASASVTTAEINLGHLRFVPVADANGDPYTTFSYKVYDNASAASNDATMTVKVTPVNDLPVAADGTITTNEDTKATGNLPAATDVEHDAITYAKGTGPSHGTLVLNADGSYEYTPAANYNGPDSFTYTVSDGSGSNTYNVSITVNPVNDAPVLAVSPVTVAQGATITLTTRYLNATDVDTGNGSLTYTVTSAPGKGTIKVSGTAATTFTQQDVIDGKVSYTANSYGSDQSDSFSVSVSDGALSDAKPVAVTITSANVAPTSTGGAVTTAEDTNYVFRASDFNFSDFNTGDAMTKVSISAAPGAGKLQAYVSGAWQDVGASASVTTAEINLGHLRFVP